MIDTKKAREMRAAGTKGKWIYDDRFFGRVVGEDGEEIADAARCEPDDQLIAYAVNALEPMADEIDRLRARVEELEESLEASAPDSRRGDWDDE